MATVRLTDRLKSDIKNAINVELQSQTRNIDKPETQLNKEFLAMYIDKYNLGTDHAHHATLVNTMEYTWVERLEQEDGSFKRWSTPLMVSDLHTQMLLPVAVAQPYSVNERKPIIMIDCELEQDIMCPTLQRILSEYASRKRELMQFQLITEKLVKRCTTLKQLIEAWPQATQYVPQDALNKHYQVDQKRRKNGVYLDDDEMNLVNQVHLTNKLLK